MTNNHNLNFNTLLPKLAIIFPLLAIGLHLALHLIRIGSLVSFDWQWTVVGLLASGYFDIFCKDLAKDNQNYKKSI
ncbi:bacteriocin immunity protein [Streptococcus oralis]|uniref:bacteriocin immunity protein n=1 Tax=Streptococcus oralis TaxID=1303 RepID=UPI0022838875|nr:bacteriocin immunity protein [Streptococcus oralis]MCY7108706.1 bacteriocin immunity protein [Streptococcus oralis]